jgi:UDP-N-acetylmuramate: L-alanyl-gamma-D-glutamyl-meso-diaminopimelate ligase
MAGIARLARASGHHVTGSDKAAYPPMSDQLRAQGIEVELGLERLSTAADLIVIGNAMTRGMPVVEQVLNERWPYTSGPQWLHDHVLGSRDVIAVAGTHGKTTTSSMLAWILECSELQPGFLIGGVPGNFDVSARLGTGPFVVEADEYDTAFFDKRAKFVHYPARVFVINNLEHDHADIYPDITSIVRQFHHAVRALPGNAAIIRQAKDEHIDSLLEQGCWTPVSTFGDTHGDWHARAQPDCAFDIYVHGQHAATVQWQIPGAHNRQNALAAVAAAAQFGVSSSQAAHALGSFKLPARRLELRHLVAGVSVYLDFAHHPTAIATTIDALRDANARTLVAVEPRSNTMRAGIHGARLPQALDAADYACFLSAQPFVGAGKLPIFTTSEEVARALTERAQDGDNIVLMSNGNLSALADLVADILRKT